MLDVQSVNLIKIVSVYINAQKHIGLINPDWNRIYELAHIHNLEGLIYAEICGLNLQADIEPNILSLLKKDFFAAVVYSTKQESESTELINILSQNKIKHIIFKGFVLRDYYPDKETRTMGDIDIVIEPQSREKVHKLLLNSGYEFDEAGSKKEVFNYKKNSVLFEIHTKIIQVNITNKTDFEEYFADNFRFASCVNDHTYEFNKEHHFVYLIAHMAKHFQFSGFGVRILLDIPVFINHFKNELDWEHIKNELEILGLCEFTGCILKICNEWFDTNIPAGFEVELNAADIEAMGNYIISGGVFGYHNRNIDVMRSKNDGIVSRITNMIKLIFPSYEHISRRYVWAGNMPKYLLPLIWIRVWFYRIFVLRENSFKRISKGLKNNKDAIEHSRLKDIFDIK